MDLLCGLCKLGLMVGVGGCELLKTLALLGFQDIHIVNFSPFYHAYVLFFDFFPFAMAWLLIGFSSLGS